MVVALACAAMGAFPILIAAGVIQPEPGDASAPRWVVFCCGLVFELAAAALVVGYAIAGGVAPDGDLPPGTPFAVRLVQYVLGLGIAGALAAIASWIAFGPGPRPFTASVPFIGRGPASDLAGRVVFGFGAVLMLVFIAALGVVSVRRLRLRTPPDHDLTGPAPGA